MFVEDFTFAVQDIECIATNVFALADFKIWI